MCHMRALERERVGSGGVGAICEYQYCLSFSFQLYISEVPQNVRGGTWGGIGEKQTQQTVGDLI